MTERDDLEPVWKALADPTRRRILDLLRDGPRTTGDLCDHFSTSRFAVMKHLGVLESAGLVLVRRKGRERWNYLNAAPVQAIADRWIERYAGHWARSVLDLRQVAETDVSGRADEETEQMATQLAAELGTIQIEQEVTIGAPPERVFAALTEQVDRWWHHSFEKNRRAVVLEPKVGGRFHEVWGDSDGALYATVTRIREPNLLYLTGPMGMDGAVIGVIHFDLEAVEGGTLLKLSHRAIGDVDDQTLADYSGGWTTLLERGLKAVAEGAEPYA